MQRTHKSTKVISLVLSFMMVLSLFSITGVTAYAQESGNWDGVSYTLDDDGILTISGTGVIPDNAFYNDSRVKQVVFDVDCDITSIGAKAFSSCNSCTSIEINSQSIIDFGKDCLMCGDQNKHLLESIIINAKGVNLNKNTFYSFGTLKTLVFNTEQPVDFLLNEFVYGMAVIPTIKIPPESRIVTPGAIVFSGDNASEYQQLYDTAIENGYTEWIDYIIEDALNNGCTVTQGEPQYEIINSSNYDKVFPKYATLRLIGQHMHTFTYSAFGSKITALCSNDDSDCNLTDCKIILQLKKPEKTVYDDGESQLASLSGLYAFNKETGKNISVNDIKYAGRSSTVYEESNTAPNVPGKYKATITVEGCIAYVNYEIKKATPTITAVPNASEITYGQTLENSTLSGGKASVEGVFEWADTTIKPKVSDSKKTEYDVVFTPDDSENYNSVVFKITLTVNKADPEFEVPTGLTAVCGNTLADVTLPKGWAWADNTQDVGTAGNNIFKANYTPDDTDNYNIAENIDVTVAVFEYHAAVDATCEEDGNIEYWQDGDGNKYSDPKGENLLTDEETIIEKLGHNFIHFMEWVWDGFNRVIAWIFCDNDPEHIETIDVPLTVDSRVEPTCTEDGYIHYVASIEIDGQIYTTEKVETLDHIGHDWGEPEYTWADDYSTVTAKRTCKNDASHIETETVNTVYSVVKEPTFDTPGVGRYTSNEFENKAFEVQTIDVEIPVKIDTETDTESDTDTATDTESDTDTATDTESDTDTATDTESDTDTATDTESDSDTETDTETDEPNYGDINQDGKITARDSMLAQRYAINLTQFTEEQLKNADVDLNGKVNTKDALYILQASINLRKLPVVKER